MEAIPNAKQTATPCGVLVRATTAAALIVAAIAALAISSLIQSDERAAAQSRAVMRPAPSMATVTSTVPPHSGEAGSFAFGYVVFDWNPEDPGGVPGFDSWPPGSRPQ